MNAELEGLKEYLDMLKTLENDAVVNKILGDVNKESLKGLQQGMKNSLSFPQSLLKQIKILSATVGGNRHPNAKIVGFAKDAYPIRFLNTGTIERYTKKGAYRGSIQGKKTIGPFIEANSKRTEQETIQNYGENLSKIIAKKVKRINKNK